MATITISLPDSMKAFVAEQVRAGGYSTTSEYVRSLFREAQREREERDHDYGAPDRLTFSTREELEEKLREGLESEAREMTRADWDWLRSQISDSVHER